MVAYFRMWSKFAVFQGRATRKEYWPASVMHSVVILVLYYLVYQNPLSENILLALQIYVCASILPMWGLTARRFHDIGQSGWCILVNLIPIVGVLLVFAWMCTGGQAHPNQYGPYAYAGQGDFGVPPPIPGGYPEKEPVQHEGARTAYAAQPQYEGAGARTPYTGQPQYEGSQAAYAEQPQYQEQRGGGGSSMVLGILCVVLLCFALSGQSKLKPLEAAREELEQIKPHYEFLYKAAVLIAENSTTYHRVDCPEFEGVRSFYVFNPENAKGQGYQGCSICIEGEM